MFLRIYGEPGVRARREAPKTKAGPQTRLKMREQPGYTRASAGSTP